jgi:hypothetical protein
VKIQKTLAPYADDGTLRDSDAAIPVACSVHVTQAFGVQQDGHE